MSILMEAQGVLDGPRQDTYGDPVETCARIGAAWGALLGIEPLKASTVASMMVVLKAVREEAGPSSHRDNWVDIAGYAEIGARGAEIAQIAAGMVRDRELAEVLPPCDGCVTQCSPCDRDNVVVGVDFGHKAEATMVAFGVDTSQGFAVKSTVVPAAERRSSFRPDARTCGCPYVGAGACRTPIACAEQFSETGEGEGA